MAIGADVLISNDNKKVNDMDILIDNSLKKITKAYVLKKGQLYLWWGGEKITGFVIFENGVFNHVPDGLDIKNNIIDAKDYVESSENINYYDIAVLSEFFLTNKTLWVHTTNIETIWDIDEMLCINSHNNDFSNQFATNAIYIPINRINSPAKLKIIGRGNLNVIPIYYDETSNNLIGEIENTIDICDMDSKEYEIDLNSCPCIDYIRIGAKHKSKVRMADNYSLTGYSWIYYEINSLSCKKNGNNEYFFQVTEGWAFGVIAIANELKRVFFYSLNPFTIVEKNSSQSFSAENSYSYRDKTYYCISVLNLDINDNIEGSINYTYYTIPSEVSNSDREQALQNQIGYYLFYENIFIQPPSLTPATVTFNDQPPQIRGIDPRWFDLLKQPIKFITNSSVSITTTRVGSSSSSTIGLNPSEHSAPVYGMAYHIPNHTNREGGHQNGVVLVSKEFFTFFTMGLYQDHLDEAVPFKVDNLPVCYYTFLSSPDAIEVSSAVLSEGEVPSGFNVDTNPIGWTYGFDDPKLSFVFYYMIENGEIIEGIDEDTIALMSLQQVSRIEVIGGTENLTPTPTPIEPEPVESSYFIEPIIYKTNDYITYGHTSGGYFRLFIPDNSCVILVKNGYNIVPIVVSKIEVLVFVSHAFNKNNLPTNESGNVQFIHPVTNAEKNLTYYICTAPAVSYTSEIDIEGIQLTEIKNPLYTYDDAAWELAYIADQRGLL